MDPDAGVDVSGFAAGKRALVIGAHPDDAEFGCYGTLQRFASRAVVVLSAGERGGAPDQRRAEAQAAARLVDAEIDIGDLPDTELPLGPAITAITAAIERWRPDVIFTTSRRDDHQDHATVGRAVHVATRGFCGLVLAYLTPSAVTSFVPQALVVLGAAEWERKNLALQAHRSQGRRSYLSPAYLETTARYWATQAGAPEGWAEPFEVVRWVESP